MHKYNFMKEYMKSITFYTYDFEKKYTAGWKGTLLLGDMSYGSTIRPATGQIIQDNDNVREPGRTNVSMPTLTFSLLAIIAIYG